MPYIYKWIEGKKNFDNFCLDRFGEKASFSSTIGYVGNSGVSVRLIYKHKRTGGFAEMYLLYKFHPKGTIHWISDVETMTYEDIIGNKQLTLF